MQIKLSKQQWEAAGKKAGWIKTAQQTSYQQGYIDKKIKELSPQQPNDPEYIKGWQAGNNELWDEHEKEHGKLKMPQVKESKYAIIGKSGPEIKYFCESPTQGKRMIPRAGSMATIFTSKQEAEAELIKLQAMFKGITDWQIVDA